MLVQRVFMFHLLPPSRLSSAVTFLVRKCHVNKSFLTWRKINVLRLHLFFKRASPTNGRFCRSTPARLMYKSQVKRKIQSGFLITVRCEVRLKKTRAFSSCFTLICVNMNTLQCFIGHNPYHQLLLFWADKQDQRQGCAVKITQLNVS